MQGNVNPRVATILLGSSMFLTGASGFIFECILSTVATFVLGNSVEQFSVIISLMMLMMGVAGIVQRKISDENLIEKFLTVEIVLAILGGFAPIAVYSSYAWMDTHFVLVQYLFVVSIGFAIGLEIPLVLRINRHFVPQLKSNIASVLSTDYLGAFIGAVIWVYVLLRYFPLTEISFFVAGMNFIVALVTYAYFSHCGAASRRLAPAIGIGATAVVLLYGYWENRNWNELLEQRFYDEPIVFSTTTRYQHIVLTGTTDPTDYRLYINGNLQFSSLDEHIYHEMLVHPAMTLASSRRRVLILGGGDGLALREVLKYHQPQEVTLVDIDPGMIELARSHDVLTELNDRALADARVRSDFLPVEDVEGMIQPVYGYSANRDAAPVDRPETVATVRVYTVDADRMIDRLHGVYDVIIIDFPDPNSVELVKLYSREFYFRLRGLLDDDGIVAIQSTSPYHAKESFLCIVRTIERAGFDAMPYHDNVPSFGDWGWVLAWNRNQRVASAERQIADMREFAIPYESLRYITPDRFRASLTFGKNALVSSNRDINTLMTPVLLRYYLTESWRR